MKYLAQEKLELVKKARNADLCVEGRRCWFERHCGQRMARIKVYNSDKSKCSKHQSDYKKDYEKDKDSFMCICPNCNYHFRYRYPIGCLDVWEV